MCQNFVVHKQVKLYFTVIHNVLTHEWPTGKTKIRVSVDALYRDGMGQISRDSHTKRHQNWQRTLSQAFQADQYLAIHYGQKYRTCPQYNTLYIELL